MNKYSDATAGSSFSVFGAASRHGDGEVLHQNAVVVVVVAADQAAASGGPMMTHIGNGDSRSAKQFGCFSRRPLQRCFKRPGSVQRLYVHYCMIRFCAESNAIISLLPDSDALLGEFIKDGGHIDNTFVVLQRLVAVDYVFSNMSLFRGLVEDDILVRICVCVLRTFLSFAVCVKGPLKRVSCLHQLSQMHDIGL